jgi:intein-encoded DNA endonuclease-like protein
MEKLLLNETEVINQYTELKNIHKVAKCFNVSVSPISRILKSNGVDLTNRRYEVNHDYFNIIDTQEKAYWLGFLYADGYIRERKSGNSLEMKLSIKDKGHLENFRKDISSNHYIKESFNKVKYKSGFSESHMCHLAMYSTNLVNSIKSQGFHSRKTFTIKFPSLNKKLIHHFIRGYFDGDGSFSFNTKTFRPHTNLVCASEVFRSQLMKILKENDIDIKQYSDISLHIQDKLGNLKFYNYIYKNSNIHLNRKKEKYEEFRKHYKYSNYRGLN